MDPEGRSALVGLPGAASDSLQEHGSRSAWFLCGAWPELPVSPEEPPDVVH